MKVIFRVNNEFVGMMHLSDKDNADMDLHLIPRSTLLPKGCSLNLLKSNGFNKGDPLELEFDTEHGERKIVAIRRMNGESLWPV